MRWISCTKRPARSIPMPYAWRNADPELRPLIEEARRAVTRLSEADG